MTAITKPLADRLRDSLRFGLLFGRHDEPLNAYGLRIVRVILDEMDRADVTGPPPRATGALRDGAGKGEIVRPPNSELKAAYARVDTLAAENRRLSERVEELEGRIANALL